MSECVCFDCNDKVLLNNLKTTWRQTFIKNLKVGDKLLNSEFKKVKIVRILKN